MIDVVLCIVALMAGGVTLELFCDRPVNGETPFSAKNLVPPAGEYECGNPS